MNQFNGWIVVAIAGAAVGTAWAGPDPSRVNLTYKATPQVKASQASSPGHTDGPGFSDSFDTYANGSPIVGQGGWQFWGVGALDAFVDNTTSASAPNSLVSVVETDVVQVFDHTSGQWVCKVKTFYPSTSVGIGYFIMLNTFSAPYISGGNWSLEIHFNDPTFGANTVGSWYYLGNAPGIPIIFDQWVELVVNIDLDADTFSVTYGGQPLASGQWSWNVSSIQGVPRIQCIDLYSQSAGFRWDDVSLVPATTGPTCYPNCDGSTQVPFLNVADFSCFLSKFAAADPYANCDGSTTPPVHNVADFSCFLGKFAAGCSAP
jgi:hypothetical protein